MRLLVVEILAVATALLIGALPAAAQTGQVYWTGDYVRRAEAPCPVAVDVAGPYAGLRDIALDTSQGKVYWVRDDNSGFHGIERANLDGSNIETIISGGLHPYAIALDTSAGKIYWTDGAILRANLDGSGTTTLVSSPDVSSSLGLALDVAAGKLYWSDPDLQRIGRANLAGC